uniref:Ovule protein n=1 Tax=Schistosoma mansoni TaxID=6183 RepID=A0A5K4F763_SCHMA
MPSNCHVGQTVIDDSLNNHCSTTQYESSFEEVKIANLETMHVVTCVHKVKLFIYFIYCPELKIISYILYYL